MKSAEVVTAFLLRTDGRVLVLRRSDRVGSYQGRWAGVSGYIESDPPLDRAFIEIEEETGIQQSDVRLLVQAEPIEVEDEAIETRWTVHPFLFELMRSDDIVLDWEHSEARWIEPWELDGMETVPGLADALRILIDGLRQEQSAGSRSV